MKIFLLNLIIFMCSALALEVWGDDFGIPGAQRLSDSEMDEFRGKYAEFYFTVDFSGSWTPTGGNANLTYNGNVNASGPDSGSTTNSGSTAPVVYAGSNNSDVRATATIGDMNGSRGIMQISLVPGNNNVVNNRMNIYLTVINVMNTSQVASVRESLLPR